MANKRLKKKLKKAAQISSNVLTTTSAEGSNDVALASLTEDNSTDVPNGDDVIQSKNKKLNLFQALRFVSLIGFVIFTALFINEVIIQPYRIKKSIDLSRSLYYDNDYNYKSLTKAPASTVAPTQPPVMSDIAADVTLIPEPTVAVVVEVTPTPDPFRDEKGRLLQFERLLEKNEDIKGWIKIEDTSIDYPVLQSGADDPDYYLSRDISKEYSKAGSLYLDYRSGIEDKTKNLVIYGHNMVSTAEKMFRPLLKYKPSQEDNNIKFYRSHPVISFDTIYETGTWKIFSVFITTPDSTADYFFDYRKSTFTDASDFLNFIYQVRIRSLVNIDTVDINENDRILMLSTCSYEVDRKDLHYRTVIAARKVRDGEATDVDVDSAVVNEQPLYAYDYYYEYGGKAPELSATFEEAFSNGTISWYKPTE